MNSPFVIINGKVRFDGNCNTTRPFCGAVCCRNTVVLLTEEESSSGFYETQEPTDGCNCSTCSVMRQSGQKSLTRNESGCVYLDGAGQCSIYEQRPSRCKDFICNKTWWNLHLTTKKDS